MNTLLFLVLAALLQSPSPASRDFISKADRYMRAQMTVNRFSGSILVAEHGKILLSKGYGLTARNSSAFGIPATRFRVGSIAMQFTDMAILQLHEKGRLDVRDSVCTYIKNCPNDWRKITLFDLMTHTSGIPAISASSDRSSKSIVPSISALIKQIEKEPLLFKPGETVDSTFSEEEVLESVIEVAAGEPYLMYLQKHIFAPAGMLDTGYDGRLRIPSKADEIPTLMPSDVQQSLLYTAGGIYSTTKDLYLWDRAIAIGRLASAKSLNEMFTPYRDGQGVGWVVQKEIGRRLLTPAGRLGTYSSSILYYPDDDVCIVVLSQSVGIDGQKVGRDLAAILFGDHYDLPIEHKTIELDPASYDNYVGRYFLASDFVLTVTKDRNGLMIGRDGLAPIKLLPESKTAFFLKGSDARIAFIMASSGRANELVLQQGGHDVSAQKIN